MSTTDNKKLNELAEERKCTLHTIILCFNYTSSYFVDCTVKK